mmetsp:Transcript_7271/g.11056  ORF Transcript_7271/g.11056 Transcript_7271/m.11056 type:complete len:160 (-) Transcript_7271:271-750(-)
MTFITGKAFLFQFLLVTMLSSVVRSFSVRSTPFVARAALTTTTTSTKLASSRWMGRMTGQSKMSSTRFMSSSEDGPDTSVVETCTDKIKAALSTDNVKVIGAYDDPNGSHISIEVVSDQFEGKRPVQRQQLVYKAIWEELQSETVHAVDSMVCKTPDEA